MTAAQTASWKLWCLALAMLSWSEDEKNELFKKQPRNERVLLSRMQTLRSSRAIPIGEFL